jgi:dolichol-phosphate mannosyltransferase
MSPATLIVTPTYNERENLRTLVEGVFATAPDAHLLVVDDASPDGTGRLADELAAGNDRLRVLHRPAKLGLGTAYLQAFEQGLSEGYELFVHMDADLSHDPRYLPDLLAAIRAGADLAIGSRNIAGGGVEGWGFSRRLLSRGGSLYARSILGLAVRDLTSGYKAIRAEVLRTIGLERVTSEGYSFLIEITYRAHRLGYRIVEVPIVFVDRRAGRSKLSLRVLLEAVRMVPALRLRALLRRL